jgi:hypothetical protein
MVPSDEESSGLEFPFQLEYDLSRWQRMAPHLRIWRLYIPLIVLGLFASVVGLAFRNWWFIGLLLLILFLFRGFFFGLYNAIIVPRQHMELIVEENVLHFVAGGERWALSLDGLLGFDELANNIWTLRHWNGVVLDIPKVLLTAGQVQFFRNWVDEANKIRQRYGIH